MHFSTLGLILSVASTASALVPRGPCNANNCLRAVRATNPPARLAQASADCSRLLYETVYPETVTEYETVQESVTDTITIDATQTDTAFDTLTVTLGATSTATVSTTLTITDLPALRKRGPTDLPSYATPCAGFSAYSSACSCIGIPASTITATTPTTTIVITETNSFTDYTTTTVETTEITVTDATTSTTTTDATDTVTATATVSPVAFKLRRYKNGVAQNEWIGVKNYIGGPQSAVSGVVGNSGDAKVFVLTPNGSFFYQNKIARGIPGITNSVIFAPQFYWTGLSVNYKCAIAANLVFTCTAGSSPANDWGKPKAILNDLVHGDSSDWYLYNEIELRVVYI